MTDEQWALVEPLLPPPWVGPKGGRREKHPPRRIVDAISYVVRTGCSGGNYRRTSLRDRRCTGTSRGRTTTAPLSASMTPCVAGSVKPAAVTRSRAPG
ncbi:transposase [Streptomyces adustus]|uniref:transposase n=1 Tax=Streptomyces adustus TaxID=1609272 RepID=UPI0035E01FB3